MIIISNVDDQYTWTRFYTEHNLTKFISYLGITDFRNIS